MILTTAIDDWPLIVDAAAVEVRLRHLGRMIGAALRLRSRRFDTVDVVGVSCAVAVVVVYGGCVVVEDSEREELQQER